MKHSALILALGGLGLLAACQPKAKPQVAAPPPADTKLVQEIQSAMQKINPRVRVGRIVAVVPEAQLAALGDVNTKDFQVGDVVSLMSPSQAVYGAAEVVRITDQAVHVKYRNNPRNSMPITPKVGDLAVLDVKR